MKGDLTGPPREADPSAVLNLGSSGAALWSTGSDYWDHNFSLADRTSFAVMERLGIVRAASFDSASAVYRFGPRRQRAFQAIR